MNSPTRSLLPHPTPAPTSPPPLTPSYFTTPSSPPTTHDLHLIHSRLRLSCALHLPSHHRSLCDWLFTTPDYAFHPHIPLPPHIFSASLCLQVLHDFLDDHQTKVPFRVPFTSCKQRKSELLLLPVGEKAGVMVGYAFCGGVGKGGEFGGRFLYDDKGTGQVLIVLHGVPMIPGGDGREVMMILAVAEGVSGREHVFLMCPRGRYSFDRLPNEVVSMSVAQAIGDRGRWVSGTGLEGALRGSFCASEGRKVMARLQRIGGEVEMRLRRAAVGMYFGGRGIECMGGKDAAAVELRREMKRRRNRESAMRSNEKRKEMWDTLKNELGELRERAQCLRVMEDRLRRENIELRLRAQEMGLAVGKGNDCGSEEAPVLTASTCLTDTEEALETLGRQVLSEVTVWAEGLRMG